MYELVQITEKSYYIQSPAKIGLVRLNGAQVCLIDSGNDKDAGKKVLRVLAANGFTLSAIYNTHSHADHIGGNRFLQEKTGCRIYAPGMECDFTRHPVLEPSLLYGGFPHKDLRHKFLMAQESSAQPLEQGSLPEGFAWIPLPGHALDMVGLRTPDDVVYLADCLSGMETLQKYKIGYVYDVAAYLDTLMRVKDMHAKMFVPAHAPATEDIAPLAQANIDNVHEIVQKILDLCAKPSAFEGILQRLFTDYGLTMTFEQHALVGSTLRSYLSYLKDAGLINACIEDNVLLWQRA